MSARSIRRSRERIEARERRRRASLAKRAGLATVAAIGSSAVLTSPALAATFEVDTLADSASDDCATGDCTLREAVEDADANPGADTITFDDALAGTITLSLGQLNVDDTAGLTITDTGTNEVTISGNTSTRIFEVRSYADLTVDGLGLTEGFGDGGSYAGFVKYGGGGAILAGYESTVRVTNSNLYDNYAETKGGAISSEGATVTVTNSTITGNFAGPSDPQGPGEVGFGGGVASTGIKYGGPSGSRADRGPGQASGSIADRGPGEASLTISGNSTISDNGAFIGGGVASSGDKYALGPGPDGGDAATDLDPSLVTLDVVASTITGNEGFLGGGSFSFYSDSSFTGADVTDNYALSGAGISTLASGLGLGDTTVSDNQAFDGGGGVAAKYGSSRIVDSLITGNEGDFGGGVIIAGEDGPSGDVQGDNTILRTTIADNYAAEYGGGFYLSGVPGGTTTTVQQSTISGNRAGPEGSGIGGGIAITDYVYGDFALVDSTVSGNTATSGGGVGFDYDTSAEPPPPPPRSSAGDAVAEGGSLVLSNSTIVDNTAVENGGGLYLGGYDPDGPSGEGGFLRSTIALSSTVVGGNIANGAPEDLGQADDASGGGFTLTNSLIETPGSPAITQDPAGASLLGVDPELGGLNDNGGPTLTHLPSDTSPLLDVGLANGLATDQRGEPRTVDLQQVPNGAGDGTDIGSVELAAGPNPPPPDPPNPPADTRRLLRDEVPGGCEVPYDRAEQTIGGDATSQRLAGGPGSDILRGFGGDDDVLGLGGDDCLTGDTDSDTVDGGSGDDFADGGPDDDVVTGDTGNDELRGADGNDRLELGEGDDKGVGGGGEDRLSGDEGNDAVRGRYGADDIAGDDGDDAVRGGGGDDKVNGNSGDDTLRGGGGDDVLKPGTGVDDINCGKGDDEVIGASAEDTVAKNCETVG